MILCSYIPSTLYLLGAVNFPYHVFCFSVVCELVAVEHLRQSSIIGPSTRSRSRAKYPLDEFSSRPSNATSPVPSTMPFLRSCPIKYRQEFLHQSFKRSQKPRNRYQGTLNGHLESSPEPARTNIVHGHVKMFKPGFPSSPKLSFKDMLVLLHAHFIDPARHQFVKQYIAQNGPTAQETMKKLWMGMSRSLAKRDR